MKTVTRRDFLRATVQSAAALGAMNAFGRIGALAAGASPYQALVCVFLAGGNDGHNTVVPNDAAGYTTYKNARQGLALKQSSLLPISNNGAAYGLHPSLTDLQQIYNQGHCAVVANVGNLVRPLKSGEKLGNAPATDLPTALFSHSDQTSQWQSADPTGLSATGWGGRSMDTITGQNGSAVFPAITSTGGCGLFCTGGTAASVPATVPPSYSSGGAPTGIVGLNTAPAGAAAAAAVQLLIQSGGENLQLVQAANGILGRGNQYATTLSKLLQTNQISTPFPATANNPLAGQLLAVANIMAVRNQLGLTRQIFFCQLGGFDTHGDQAATQQALLAQFGSALGAFYKATQELGLEQSVTTFTASEFGRTLQPSGSDGTDHAWGNHHFVMGGAVQGGRFYGSFPSLVLGGANDANSRGTLIPTTAAAQYGATLAQWFGVPQGSLAAVFPPLANFQQQNLGFLG